MSVDLASVDQEILQHLFGSDVTVSYAESVGSKTRFEVNKLDLDVQPLQGDLLATGEAHYVKDGRRTHYLIRIGGQLANFRICTAAPDSGYAAFATGHIMEDTSENEAHVKRSISTLCDC